MQSVNNIVSRPDSVDFSDSLSLGHILIKNLTKNGDKIVLVSGETGQALSAIQLRDKCIEISKSLLAAGIQPGDKVSIVSENRFEFVFVLFGTIFLNCPVAPLNHTYSDRELVHSFNLSKPKFVFASASTANNVLNAVKNLSYVEKIIVLDDVEKHLDERITKWEDFTNPKYLQNVNFELKPVNILTTTCLIMCSSGTTGFPKARNAFLVRIQVTIIDIFFKGSTTISIKCHHWRISRCIVHYPFVVKQQRIDNFRTVTNIPCVWNFYNHLHNGLHDRQTNFVEAIRGETVFGNYPEIPLRCRISRSASDDILGEK